MLGVTVINTFSRAKVESESLGARSYFFSFFPQMFSAEGGEEKYGSFVRDSDRYVVTILSDGVHQKVSMAEYAKYSRVSTLKGHLLVDRFFRLADVWLGLIWLCKTSWYYCKYRNRLHVFSNIDVTGLVRPVLCFSLSHIGRLIVFANAFRRFVNVTQLDKLVYYPHEYPFGRMISYVLSKYQPSTIRVGFQMGIVSERRTEQFLATGEARHRGSYLDHVPIPDLVLAETKEAKEIYRKSGYKNVEVMERIYRYEYLASVKPKKCVDWVLIAPGLHDGEFLLRVLESYIRQNKQTTFVLKPHPRADNRYLSNFI